MENKFDDMILLHKRFNSYKVNCNNISLATKDLNQRKDLMHRKMDHIEGIGFDLPEIIVVLYSKLLEKVETSKSFFDQWKAANFESGKLFKQAELFEKRKLNSLDSELSVFENQQIELMILKWSKILDNQELLIEKRNSALYDEEKIVGEIEKNLALI